MPAACVLARSTIPVATLPLPADAGPLATLANAEWQVRPDNVSTTTLGSRWPCHSEIILKHSSFKIYSPVNIFLIVIGRSPYGESFPPSKLNPSPAPSFFSVTVMGGPRGTSTNFKSRKKGFMKIYGLSLVMYFCWRQE